MAKRVIAVGLMTLIGDVIRQECMCCKQPYDTIDTKEWSSLGKEFCPVCCTTRCDAYPGECPNQNSLAKPYSGSDIDGPMSDRLM